VKTKIFRVDYSGASEWDNSLCCFISVSGYEDSFLSFQDCWENIRYNIETDNDTEMSYTSDEIISKITEKFEALGWAKIKAVEIDSVFI